MKSTDLKKYKLPDSPGVYFFKRSPRQAGDASEVLYIGKATSLKDRVRSYFSNDVIKTRGPLIVDMVTQSNKVDFIKTDSVLEALVLEAELIKKHKPIYNTKEKDNKSYNFVVITKDDFPKLKIERGRALSFDNTPYKKVFGPFPSQSQLKEALKIIRKIFPYITNSSSPRTRGGTGSPLYRQIGLEPDISSTEAKKEYAKTIRNVSSLLGGKKKELIRQLEEDMKAYAKNKKFERAAKVRNQIFALQHLRDVSLIKKDEDYGQTKFRIESYDVAHMRGSNSVGVMTVVEDGEIKKSDYRKFILRDTKKGDDVGGLKEILTRRLKHDEWPLPDLFVIDGGRGQKNVATRILKEEKLDIPVVSVVKDERHKPREILGINRELQKYEQDILISNNEAHRFAIEFYRKKQRSIVK